MTPARTSTKTSIEQLSGVARVEFEGQALPATEPLLLHFTRGGYQYDMLWRPQPGATRLFVLFSGDALRAKYDPPVFQRWTWADFFPGHCLYIADPTLHVHRSLGLAWYAGKSRGDPLPVIARSIRQIARRQGVPMNRVFSYGSSAGGFAALRIALTLPDIGTIAINPQTDITAYPARSVERFLRLCYAGRTREAALAEFPDRMTLLPRAPTLAGRRLIYIQNTLDTVHYEHHFKPFCAAMGVPAEPSAERGPFRRILFAHEGGHSRAETPEVFAQAMAIVRKWTAPRPKAADPGPAVPDTAPLIGPAGPPR